MTKYLFLIVLEFGSTKIKMSHDWCPGKATIQVSHTRWRILASCGRIGSWGLPWLAARTAPPISFYFAAYHVMRELPLPFLHRKDLEETVCHESDWENPRKYLFIDLDGRTLGLPPPVSVFPKTEAEWTGQFFNTGGLCLTMMPMAKAAGM